MGRLSTTECTYLPTYLLVQQSDCTLYGATPWPSITRMAKKQAAKPCLFTAVCLFRLRSSRRCP